MKWRYCLEIVLMVVSLLCGCEKSQTEKGHMEVRPENPNELALRFRSVAGASAHFVAPAEMKAMKQLKTLVLPVCLVRNLASLPLAYMHRFGAGNILPQRTGNNWWCP